MRKTSRSFLIASLSLALLALSWPAQASAAQAEPSWTGWLGCWELVQETEAGEELAVEGQRLVCLEPAETSTTVQMTTWVDDRVVLLQEVVADGRDHPVEEGGCVGTERARFSTDGQRILMSAELSCEGQPLRTSGISLLPTSSSWADIQVSEVGDQRELLVRRYRRVDAGDRIADDREAEESLLRRTLRQSATAPLDTGDIVEALEYVDPAAVEAMLLESGDEFDVRADTLLELASADVPEQVIDLMVALSYPDYFAVHEGEAEEAWDRGRYRNGRWWGWGPAFFGGYGYYSPYFSPFSYGYYWGRPVGGTVIVRNGPHFGGKVVKGRGYTRVTSRRDSDGGFSFGRLFGGGDRDSGRRAVGRSGSSGDRSGGSVATPRGRSGGSSGRTAVPRSGSGKSGSSGKSGGGSAKAKGKSGGGSR